MSLVTRWLLVSVLFLYLLWLSSPSRGPAIHLPVVEDNSLTVVLPVVLSTLASLDQLLAPFLVPTTTIAQVVIVCPSSLASDVHRKLTTVRNPNVLLYPWSGVVHHAQASVEAVARIQTQWVLLLDEHGFKHVAECDRAYLLHPRAIHLPVGPRGFTGSALDRSPLSYSDHIQPAAFLVPPFVAPSHLLANVPFVSPPSLFWPALGAHIAKSAVGWFGGIVIGAEILDKATCNPRTGSNHGPDPDLGALSMSNGLFVLAFPNKQDLQSFIPATCKLKQQGYAVLAYLYDTIDDAGSSIIVDGENCTVAYSKHSNGLSDWLNSLGTTPDIVIGLDHQDLVSSAFSLILELPPFLNTTLIRLPRRELPYTEWIGTLTIDELRHWNVPEITLSVITNNRPHSLQRLLGSIQRTLFYGDKINIRINMDQTADPETLQIVRDLEWPHGDIFLHHRVVHGGLLPAVVESWYPHCDDSYGLLLEDDIELSPLAYAWIKMTLLRYKYGASNPSSKLFGISLYQQNIIELRPTGRQPFNPRKLFRTASLADPSTPYLSQIPCSWGALYFPSPWRAFHDYLSLRLSQPAPAIDHPIVPGVRSNKWTKSWKKYFIELVYLQGYVMLYPNYDDFVSLSTNHLEVGSHVRDEPGEAYVHKKRLFELALMPLVGALARVDRDGDGDGVHGPGLLDLPGGALPDWDQLPVLDLLGQVTSLAAIQRRGDQRRAALDACAKGAESLGASVRDLLCPATL